LTEFPVTVIYHADCIDGFGAAYAAWRSFGERARYWPMHHGEAWDNTALSGHDVFILDFSFPPETLTTIAAIANTVTQIDHHLSAHQAWADLLQPGANQLESYQTPDKRLKVMFDLNKSGARLAWESFQPDQTMPLILGHIEDQDLWRFALPGTREICRALRLLPFDFMQWHELITATALTDSPRYQQMISQGAAINDYMQQEINALANSHLRMPARVRGEPVDAMQALRHGQAVISDGTLNWLAVSGIAINANGLFASELGNQLAEQSGTFALIWQLAGDGEVKASLRSKGDFDVAAIAARYGGGGHRNAAGFRLPAAQFMAEVLQA
jgi:oligoribonuclease NrnB/cAMP/cGMP phosphodiesterase (DHH superfamily)